MTRLTLSVCVTLALGSFAPRASAFCRTSSCELGEEERVKHGADECTRDARDCVTEGNPLHWPSPCLSYAVQRDGSTAAGITAEAFQAQVAQAFSAWEGVACPGGGSPRFHAQFQGLVSCDRHEAVCGTNDKNVNVMMLHDSGWPDAPTTIGLTRPSGGTTSGLITDADLEINAQDYDFSAGATGPRALDLSQVLAHEVGHFLGLDHSDVAGALMSADYAGLQLSRELLTADDIAAICSAYPPGAALDCPAPPPPAYDECQVTPGTPQDCVLPSMTHDHKSSGCSAAPPGRADHESGAWLLVGLLGLLRVTSAGRRRESSRAGSR